jgi:inhibitor of cysteine peptidase
MADYVFAMKDNGGTVSLATQTVFNIELEENPTTGYRWNAPQFDNTHLVLESDQFSARGSTNIGAGGVRRFSFRVKTLGASSIHIEYARPWEKNAGAKPAAEFQIAVIGTQ